MSAKLQRLSNRHLLDRFLSKQNLGVEQKHEDDGNLNCALNSDSVSYAALRNIPKEMHSKELRRYFSSFVENAKFSCFHYRHRPELQASSQDELASSSTTNCCIISFYTLEDRNEFVKEFHGRHWMNKDGIEIPRRCFIDRILIRKDGEACSSLSMADSDLKTMLELRPPAVMPKGNVGTPSDFFLEQIRLCKLPSSIISKLGIQTSRRKRKFDAVPFAYDSTASTTRKTLNDVPDDSLRRDKTASFLKHRIQSIRDKAVPDDPTEKIYRERANDNDDDDDKDDDQCEEWERHEALHEDVTEQDRTKPKKYEEEMEVVWEKGGPGLVWYTDKNYWDEREKGTDCDWAWADDWDVDFSVYYEGKSAGELDARHAVEIREDEELRLFRENEICTKK